MCKILNIRSTRFDDSEKFQTELTTFCHLGLRIAKLIDVSNWSQLHTNIPTITDEQNCSKRITYSRNQVNYWVCSFKRLQNVW